MPYAQALYILWRALFSSVAVIVRTKDRPVFLARALQNIAEQRYTQYTVYVVDDGGNQEESQQIKGYDFLKAKASFRASLTVPILH